MKVLYFSRPKLLAAVMILVLALGLITSKSVGYLSALGSDARLVPI